MPAIADTLPQAGRVPPAPADPLTGPLLVATDGLETADAAFRVALELATRTGAEVQVCSVFEPVVAADIQFAPIPALPAGWYGEQKAARLDAAKAQLARTVGAETGWPVVQLDGETASALVVAAREAGAQLLLVGRGRHGWLERVLGGETVTRLLRGAEVPVLAVEPTHTGLFRRVVIATDFSPQSIHAARVATRYLAPDATVYLANVKPRPAFGGPAYDSWVSSYERMLPAAFDAVRTAMAPPATMVVEPVTLLGDAARALVDFATAARADLIVSATHGYGFMHRLVLGSVATELLRYAPCSFLCVPGSAVEHASSRAQLAARYRTDALQQDTWADELADLSRDEGGRPATLEVDLPVLGAQTVLAHVPFLGAAYERAHDRVQLMFGPASLAGYHLTHVLEEVRGIDLLRDDQELPRVLRFVHGDGQTLLTLE